MIRDQKLWFWHLAAAAVIVVLLALHMAIMHLDALLRIVGLDQAFNPAGDHPIDWENVVARGRGLFFTMTYVLLLGAALFHGLYGLRNVILEAAPSRGIQRLLGWALVLVGAALFVIGSWAAWAGHVVAGSS